jgi:hypothetical protein
MTTEQFSIPEPNIRGLVEDALGPLRRFTGVIAGLEQEVKPIEGTERKQIINKLNCADIEVVETNEPFPFPIYTVRVSYSNKVKSKWGTLAASIVKVVDSQYTKEQQDPKNPAYVPPEKRPGIKDLIGKRVGFVVADGVNGRPNPPVLYDGRDKIDKPTPCWTVFSVGGIVAGQIGKSPVDRAKELLNGKTLVEFNNTVLQDALVRSDMALVTACTKPISAPDSFVATMVAAGLFTVDDKGVYHKK